MLQGLVHRMETDDPALAAHGSRVADLAHSIAEELGMNESALRRLRIACNLHDIGKVDIDPDVLWKPGPLVGNEWDEMRRHPELGFEMITGLVHPEIADTVLAHHERYDGLGYPFQRKGNEIPLLARILSVADTFDAITSERCYQRSLPTAFAVEEIRFHSGTQFDPEVVEAFTSVADYAGWTESLLVA